MIEGKLEDSKILRFRVALGSGTYGPFEWRLTINADSKAIFVEVEGHKVVYNVEDMLADALDILVKAAKLTIPTETTK